MRTNVDELKQSVKDLDRHVAIVAEAVAASMEKQSKSSRAWDLATKLSVPAVLALVGWGLALDRRVQWLENTRSAIVNGNARLEVQIDQLQKEIRAIGERLVRIETEVKK